MSNSAVLADAQFSAAKIIKPFRDFEQVYQGQRVDTPIAIPGNLDPLAGKPGFDSNLLAGVPVPLGSKLILWMPTIYIQLGASQLEDIQYQYRIVWRLRNLQDFALTRAAYHFPRQSPGVSSQYVVPSAGHSILWEQTPVVGPSGTPRFQTKTEFHSQSVMESISFPSTVVKPPLVPSGAQGSFQQGIGTGGLLGSNQTVSYNAVQFDVVGDEFMVLVTRKPRINSDETWDFGDTDSGFSAFFGTANGMRQPIKDLGIYVMTGANP